jgi:tight adherence protein B
MTDKGTSTLARAAPSAGPVPCPHLPYRAFVGWSLLAGLVAVRCVRPLAGAVAVVGCLVALPLRQGGRRRRAVAHFDDELVALLRATAGGLRSGAVLRTALVEAAADCHGVLRDDLDRLVARLDRGVVAALTSWSTTNPRPSVRLVAGGLALGHSTGGVTAAVVDALADTVRLRLDGRDEAVALATQARLSALLLAGGPLLFLLAGLVTRSASTAFLVGSVAGRACLAAGILLDLTALAVMVALTRSVFR